jgi:hypothetical protein
MSAVAQSAAESTLSPRPAPTMPRTFSMLAMGSNWTREPCAFFGHLGLKDGVSPHKNTAHKIKTPRKYSGRFAFN